jgi:hypothetical protein
MFVPIFILIVVLVIIGLWFFFFEDESISSVKNTFTDLVKEIFGLIFMLALGILGILILYKLVIFILKII